MRTVRTFGAFLCLALGVCVLRARVPTPNESAPFFPVAVWYSGGLARAPMLEQIDSSSAERWGKDLDAIKAVGFNTVKTWVDWTTAEPQPGKFNFQNLDLLMRLAQERGLRVIIQIYTDSAPDWVGEHFPDGRFVDRSGAVITSQGAPGFCIDHAGVRGGIVQFIQELSRDADRFPALYGWDVWSEPHVINWAEFPYLANPEFCYCTHTQARFREFLRTKYGSLPALNAAWYRAFTDWQQIQPPRASTILSYTDYLDWRSFIDDKLAADLKTRVDAVRTLDHAHAITSHAASPALFTSPTDGYGEPDDWKMAASADFFGISLYPKHSESVHPWTYPMLAAGLDFARSAGHSFGKGFWVGELQAGQGVTGMRIADPVTSDDENLWIWEVVAHGAREIAVYAWYPMSSGFESDGYGLIELDGTVTPRAHAAGHAATVIQHHAQDFLRSTPAPAQVAILYNRLSYMVGGSEPSLSKLGNASRDSMMGLYRAFLEQQIAVDFIHPMDVTGGKLGQYKIVFLPFPVMLSSEVAKGVEAYIRDGGTVVAEARLAWNDARGFANKVVPGFGLSEVFGAREKVIRPADKPLISVEASSDLPGWKPGDTVLGAAFEEELEPAGGARVLGRFADGQAAIVERSYGKGKAVLVGSFLGLSYEREHADSTKSLLLSLAKAAGVSSEVEVSGPGASEVELRRLVSSDSQLLFAFNHGQKPAKATISVRLSWPVGQAKNLDDDRILETQENGGRTILRETLAGGQVLVVRLQRR